MVPFPPYTKQVNRILPMAQFKIAKLNDKNQWQVLEVFNTYDEADDKLDFYSDKFPFAYVDIIEPV
jgi:hypothetical protein